MGSRARRTKSRNSGIQEPDRIRTFRQALPKLPRTRFKILVLSICWGSFFGVIFRTPLFGHRAALEAHQKESKSLPGAPRELLGCLRFAVSAENSINPCIKSTCASGVFWASRASRGARECPYILVRCPKVPPWSEFQQKKKGSQNGPFLDTNAEILQDTCSRERVLEPTHF